jgi:hypothetical protein
MKKRGKSEECEEFQAVFYNLLSKIIKTFREFKISSRNYWQI